MGRKKALRPYLTWRESKIHNFIRKFTEEHQYPPTLRQIGDAVGLKSTSSVSYAVGRMEEKGYLTASHRGQQRITLATEHSGMVQVCREDLAKALKLLSAAEMDADGPVARLMKAAGL